MSTRPNPFDGMSRTHVVNHYLEQLAVACEENRNHHVHPQRYTPKEISDMRVKDVVEILAVAGVLIQWEKSYEPSLKE